MQMQNDAFYMVAALTIYSIVSWFVIAAIIQGARAAFSKPEFNKRAFIIGWIILSICAIYSILK